MAKQIHQQSSVKPVFLEEEAYTNFLTIYWSTCQCDIDSFRVTRACHHLSHNLSTVRRFVVFLLIMAKVEEKKDNTPCDTRNYARYYDTPDGCDMKTKILVASRYGMVAGLVLGTYDILMYSHVVGLGAMLRRYARHVVPLGLMGATFAAVSTMALRIRYADDPLNYFLGGLACGPLAALYLRSGHGVVVGGLLLGAIGVVKKEAVDRNYEILQKFPNHMNTINGYKMDSSLMEDPRDRMVHTCGKEEKKEFPI